MSHFVSNFVSNFVHSTHVLIVRIVLSPQLVETHIWCLVVQSWQRRIHLELNCPDFRLIELLLMADVGFCLKPFRIMRGTRRSSLKFDNGEKAMQTKNARRVRSAFIVFTAI